MHKITLSISGTTFCLFLLIFSVLPANANRVEKIVKSLFFTENSTSYLALQLNTLKITSGSYEKGNLRTSGLTKGKISIFDLATGKLVCEKEMGLQDSASAFYLLGHSQGNLWIYSKKYKSGLQSLDPINLSKKVSQASIYSSLNVSIKRLIDPNWNQIQDFYGFDEIRQQLIVTNTDSNHYYIDANNFTVKPISEKIRINNTQKKSKANNLDFNDREISFKGYDYQKIKWGDSIYSTPKFLYGQFILNIQKKKKYDYYIQLADRLDSSSDQASKQNSRNISNLLNGFDADDLLLQDSNSSFFVIEKNKQAGNAVLKISSLNIQNHTLVKNWDRALSGMFYNVSKARDSREFKLYYGDFIPESGESEIYLYNNKLIVVYLMQICCIDVNSGNILWQMHLK